MIRTLWIPFVAVASLAGCINSDQDTAALSGGKGEHSAEDCECKIEGDDIGRVGTLIRLGTVAFVFEEWIAKADSPGEYVGFRLSSGATGVSYVVKAGTERYPGEGLTWDHPEGDSGPYARGISNVDFCDDYDYEDPDGDPADDDTDPGPVIE